MRRLKCLLGFHHWKTVIGDKNYVNSTKPPCRYCDARFRLTQGQINRWWELDAQIRNLRKEQRELGL